MHEIEWFNFLIILFLTIHTEAFSTGLWQEWKRRYSCDGRKNMRIGQNNSFQQTTIRQAMIQNEMKTKQSKIPET